MTIQKNLYNTQITTAEQLIFTSTFVIFYMANSRYKLPFNNALRWVALFGIFFYYFFRYVGSRNIKGLSKSGIIWFFIMIMPGIVTIISVQYMLFRAISFAVMLVAFGMCNYLDCSKERKKIYFNWISNVLIAGVVANTLFIFVGKGYVVGRFCGIFVNANGCALSSIFALVCIIYKLKTSSHKFVFGLLAVLCFIEIVLTQSRMGFVLSAIVFVMSPLMLSNKKDKGRMSKIVFAIAFMLLIGYFLIIYFEPPVISRLFENDLSRSSWEYAKEKIAKRPIFGYGYAYSGLHGIAYFFDETWVFFNSYLDLTVNCGYYGLICTIIYFLAKLCPCVKNIFKDDLTIFLLLLVASGMVMGISESFMFAVGNPIAFFFWAFFGLLTSNDYS